MAADLGALAPPTVACQHDSDHGRPEYLSPPVTRFLTRPPFLFRSFAWGCLLCESIKRWSTGRKPCFLVPVPGGRLARKVVKSVRNAFGRWLSRAGRDGSASPYFECLPRRRCRRRRGVLHARIRRPGRVVLRDRALVGRRHLCRRPAARTGPDRLSVPVRFRVCASRLPATSVSGSYELVPSTGSRRSLPFGRRPLPGRLPVDHCRDLSCSCAETGGPRQPHCRARSPLIAVVAVGIVQWVFFVEPYAHSSLRTATRLVGIRYPTMDLLMLVALAQLLLAARIADRRPSVADRQRLALG